MCAFTARAYPQGPKLLFIELRDGTKFSCPRRLAGKKEREELEEEAAAVSDVVTASAPATSVSEAVLDPEQPVAVIALQCVLANDLV